jgi:uncharacterized protein YjbI with pentapeptide repeats
MANDEHVALLKQGVTAWNKWREEDPDIKPDLSEADLNKKNLSEADLSGATLIGADLTEADLIGADLTDADLIGAHLYLANLTDANLSRVLLTNADLTEANLTGADLNASLRRANLTGANLTGANLYLAGLQGANLTGANLTGANLTGANLTDADLTGATLLNTDLTGADLTGCSIYGISAWGLKLAGAKQQNLVITPPGEPEITVDNIEVAQFVYLLLHNEKIREVIDTITSKAVLILGRFTDERKAVPDALRDELRKRNYLPILFDFAIPARRDVTETIRTLASLARFVIADATDATEVRVELHNIVPDFTSLAVQPILLRGHPEFVSLSHLTKFPWVLPIFEYDHLDHLLASLHKSIIAPAEAKVAPAEARVKALEERRRKIEAELTKAR